VLNNEGEEQEVNTQADIKDFLSQKTIAMAGLSRNEKAFSTNIKKELTAKGYRIIPVNPNADRIGGDTCYPNLAAIPEKVGGVLVVTPAAQTEKIVRDAAAAGITRVWIQQGAQSDAAVVACKEKKLTSVWGRCIMMFAEPVTSIHTVHRWFAKIFGSLPK
jgi:predicted CoA-binding protein